MQRLERPSWSRVLAGLRGTVTRDLDRENAEAGEAARALHDAETKLSQLHSEREDVAAQAARFDGAPERLAAALGSKEAALIAAGSAAGLRLVELAEQLSGATEELSRLEQVVTVGSAADLDLGRAADALRSTDVWASVDSLGGGVLASVAKYQRLEAADRVLRSAQASVDRFRAVLQGTALPRVPDLSIGGTTKTVDLLVDNLLTDLAVQHKVRGVAAEVEETRRQVQRVLDEVHREASRAGARKAGLEQERLELLMPD